MTAENYHLKWDSHVSYLNSSVATLYKNEKFADVVLYSSNSSHHGNSDIPTVGISAHKFILSSCSQFFAAMFEMSPITSPNGVLYIVLPPELSHRAIQILVQYMYSGEATVSNDILNEVLRGGEILKIRGLCRSSSSTATTSTATSTAHNSHHHGNLHTHHHNQHQHQRDPCNTTIYGNIYGNKTNAAATATTTSANRYVMEHATAQQQQQFRGLGATVMPKDSPVIVKSPKHTHANLMSSSNKHGISVNKEVAIDPEDKCCYVGPPPPPPPGQQDTLPPPPPPPITMCTEVGCNSCPMNATTAAASATIAEVESIRRRQRINSRSDERLYDERSPDERDEMGIIYERRVTVRDYYAPEQYDHAKAYVESTVARLPTPPHPHNFLAIKQEPSDWSNSAPTTNENSNDEMQLPPHTQRPHTPHSLHAHSPKQPLDFKMPIGSNAVKLESSSSTEDSNDKINDYGGYKLLICELCQQTFDDTKTLMRHLESHDAVGGGGGNMGISSSSSSTVTMASTSNGTDTIHKTYVPKKRRRISQQENNMDHVTLLCDLCSTSFETPAEWVRHMNNQHTEIELALFNSKKDGEQKNSSNGQTATTTTSTTAATTTQQAALPITHKKYASRQSIILHKHQRNSSNNNSNTNNNNSNSNADVASSNQSTSLTRNGSSMPANNLQCDQLTATTSHAA